MEQNTTSMNYNVDEDEDYSVERLYEVQVSDEYIDENDPNCCVFDGGIAALFLSDDPVMKKKREKIFDKDK